MKTITVMTIGLALAVSAFTAAAQQGQGRGMGGGRGMGAGRGPAPGFPPPVTFLFDADKDGVLSSQEINNAPAAFLKLDKNNDGQITANEICPNGLNPRGAGLLLALLDSDGNGAISPAEAAVTAAVLRKLDLNSDGKLTPDEVRLPGCGPCNGTGPRGQAGTCPRVSTPPAK